MMAVQKIAYGSPARLTGLPVAGLRYTPISVLTASPPSRPAATPAISTARAIPWVAGQSTKNGTITAAAITGRSSRILLILRAGPRSVASTVASTTPLRIIASVSSETISRSLGVGSLATPHSPIALVSASEHGLVPGTRMTRESWYQAVPGPALADQPGISPRADVAFPRPGRYWRHAAHAQLAGPHPGLRVARLVGVARRPAERAVRPAGSDRGLRPARPGLAGLGRDRRIPCGHSAIWHPGATRDPR